MAEDYPPRLAKKLADLLAEEPTEEDGDPILPAEEVDADGDAVMEKPEGEEKDDIILLNARLGGEVGAQACNYVKRLRK
jgi:hypothetical protein